MLNKRNLETTHSLAIIKYDCIENLSRGVTWAHDNSPYEFAIKGFRGDESNPINKSWDKRSIRWKI